MIGDLSYDLKIVTEEVRVYTEKEHEIQNLKTIACLYGCILPDSNGC